MVQCAPNTHFMCIETFIFKLIAQTLQYKTMKKKQDMTIDINNMIP